MQTDIQKHTHNGIQCTDCKGRCHHECAKISRHQRNNMKFIEVWKCGTCSGSPDPAETDDKPRPSTCAHCETTIRLNANRNQCNQEVHIKCTGSNCNQEQTQQNQLITRECKECANKINKGASRATCSGCNQAYHFACISSKRKGLEAARNQDWNVINATKRKLGNSKSSKTLSKNRNPVKPSN